MRELEYPFDSAQLLQSKKSLRRRLLENENLTEKKIAVLCGSTVGEMKNMLELFLLNHGVRPVFWEGQYDRFYEEVLFDGGELLDFAPDIVYLHTTVRNLKNLPQPSDSPEEVEKKLQGEAGRFQQVWDKLLEDYGCMVVQNNFEPLPYRIFGNSDVCQAAGGLSYVRRMNDMLYEYAAGHGSFFVNDLAYEAACYGLDGWFDESVYYLYKYPFAVDAIPLAAFNVANIIKSALGKNKKALALDLDNTLWGGVVGDDGAENLKLGMETPAGMAFTAFQQYVRGLSQIGVSLNVCSKNDEETARTGFDHSGSVLNLDDFIVFLANWDNKDENIRRIAGELNIGEDALVFVDDNPAERELVRDRVPGAGVPELKSPESYVRVLDRSGYFEVTYLSEDDKKRNAYYKADRARKESGQNYESYEEYLRALQMVCRIDDVDHRNRERVAQLINKTNQFNLTTRRCTAEEVEQFSGSGDNILFCGRLEDKYGDNGIVSVVMASPDGPESPGAGPQAVGDYKDAQDPDAQDPDAQDAGSVRTAHISNWLMSCRVFKRDLELAMFDELVERCREKGYRRIRGYYYRTTKNSLVRDFYGSLGFRQIARDEDSGVFEYDIPDGYEPKNHVIERKRHEQR